ncbi:MAG: hypothetical protein EP335_04655 [Alphaproteobacteria bacterium]|nr:MAG: hypothetical protein EP335_04655 [Alphaproteobacteria bacterium]
MARHILLLAFVAMLAGCAGKPSPDDIYFRDFVRLDLLEEQPACDGKPFDAGAALARWTPDITAALNAAGHTPEEMEAFDFSAPELLAYRKMDGRWYVMYGITAPGGEQPDGTYLLVHGGNFVTLDACSGKIVHTGKYRAD